MFAFAMGLGLLGVETALAQSRAAPQPAPPAAATVPSGPLADSYWSVSVGPRTVTLGFGTEPGSEQAAMRIVCTPRDSFVAINLSQRAVGPALDRLKRIAGSEMAVAIQVERARFSSAGPVVEPDDPTLPITVVLKSSLDDPLIRAMRQGKRVRVSWPQGGFEMPLESFVDAEEEWRGRCMALAGSAPPIEAIPAPSANPPPRLSGVDPASPVDADVPRPPAPVPGLPPQDAPTIIDR
jgi:hypothetical protein